MQLSIRATSRKLLSSVWEFLAPAICPSCGAELSDLQIRECVTPQLCDNCRKVIAPKIEHACRICAAPVGPYVDTTNGCVYCARDRFAFEHVIRLGIYRGQLKECCRKAKQADGIPLAAALAEALIQREQSEFQAAEADIVVSVPTHWSQRFGRRHHAAETIGQVLADRMRVPFARDLVMKVRRTPLQTDLTPTERRTNLRHAFRVRNAHRLTGRNILLVDDILTTGSTAHEVAKVLKSAGATRIVVAVIARGLGQPTVSRAEA